MTHAVIQVSELAPNPILGLSDYEPTTESWIRAIRLCNAMIQASAGLGKTTAELHESANTSIKSHMFIGPTHTVAEWAEFVMSLNHVLWLLWSINETAVYEYLEPVMDALSNLYYEWHNKALDTLKGDELSEYLRITD